MICEECGRDINAIGQDNCSPLCGYPVCEDCAKEMTEKGNKSKIAVLTAELKRRRKAK